ASDELALCLTVRGNLRAHVSPDSFSISFQTESGTTALTYGGLKAWDADGKRLTVRFENAGESAIRIAVEEKNARYPITIDPIAQQAYLKASDPQLEDSFGYSVAVSGDTVVVGAVGEDSSTTGVNSVPNEGAQSAGAAYVFVRSEGTWSQQAYLKASNSGASDSFGISVAVSGDTVVVGAKGENSSTTGVNKSPNESAGASGAAYVFVRNGSTWSQQAYLKASNTGANDEFGRSVGVSGDTVIVGALWENSSTTGVNSTPNNNLSSAGAAYVFVRNGTTWSQQAYLKASNTGVSDYFGSSVAVDGDTVVVGAFGERSSTSGVNSTPNENAAFAGAAYVFARSGSTWSQQAYLKASNPERDDYFGNSVAVSGDTLVVGAPYSNGTPPNNFVSNSGSVFVFVRNSGAWSLQTLLRASNAGPDDVFGSSVALSGNTVVVGAFAEDSSTFGVNSTPNESANLAGAAYVFGRLGSIWSQQGYLKASNTGAGDEFGYSVAVSGNTVVVGAPSEDSSTSGVNSTPNESAGRSGAAYLFDLGTGFVAPEIVIQEAASDIAIGAIRTFGSRAEGTSSDMPFTIFNTGGLDLILTGTPKVSLTGSSDFTVIVQPASLVSGPNGSSSFTVRFTPTGKDLKTASLSIPNNDADENPFVIELSGTPTTARDLFYSTIASNSDLTGNDTLPSAIPFNDGLENLLKYAFNMNLSGPDTRSLTPGTGTAGLPYVGLTGSGASRMLRVEFLRRKGSGVIYTPTKSSTLAPGSFVTMTGTPVVTSIDASWERVVVEASANPGAWPKSFALVEVSLAE
ncbi:MAG: choice-of-anchor D domain-containing protein, partial [Luteolibacter sp.]